MHELLITDQFNRYRRKELEAITKHIYQLLCSEKFEQAKGAFDLANMIIKFPTKLSSEEDVKFKIKEVIREFQSNFIRSAVDDNF